MGISPSIGGAPELASCNHSERLGTLVGVGTTDQLRHAVTSVGDDDKGRKPKGLSEQDRTTVDVSRRDFAHRIKQGKAEDTSDHDYTTVDVGTNDAGYLTAINAPFSGTPTPIAAVGPISSGEITAQNSRTPESAPQPTAESVSNRDPTTSTKLDPGFIHLVSGTLVDSYEVEKLLGAGGMGAVYGAHHERLGRRAAIKVISPSLSRDRDAVERFEQEAQALARISHPNIVGVLNVGTLPGDGRAYYIMEWLDGSSLQTLLDRGGIGFGLALYVIDQIARGLEAAHAAGIVHRDLKPDNAWLQYVGDEPRPIIKILDFGLSKLAQHQRTEHTAANVMFGTTAYMSPEQCRSSRDVGPATDVYALGCIGYQLLCGRLPFPYDNTAELVAAHLSEEPPRPVALNPSIDPMLDALLAAMLAKDPTQRPSLAHVRHVIAKGQASFPSTPRPNSPAHAAQPRALSPVALARPASVTPVDQPRTSRKVFVALGGLVVLGVVIAAVVARTGTASLDQPRQMADEPRSAIEIDSSVAPTATAVPSILLDASVPLAMPAPRVDASTVSSRSNDGPDSPVARHLLDGGEARKSDPTAVIEPDSVPPTVRTTTVDANVEPQHEAIVETEPGDAAVDVAAMPGKTSPSSHRAPPTPAVKKPPNQDRTPPVPAAKKPPKRNVISDPFKKKEITK